MPGRQRKGQLFTMVEQVIRLNYWLTTKIYVNAKIEKT